MQRFEVKKIKTRNLSDTLRNMAVGDEMYIKNSEFRMMTVYKTCYKLRREGMNLCCTVKGETDRCKVTRLS